MDWAQLLQFGGFATLGVVMSYTANKVFTAWKNGDLVARSTYERAEARADTLAGQLERNTEALAAHTVVQAQLVKAIDRQAAALERRAATEARRTRAGER